MKRIWVPFLVLLLLPASYSVQRPAGRPETTHPTHEDSIRSQTQEAGETPLLVLPRLRWSVQLALSNVYPDTAAEAASLTTRTAGRSWICSIPDRLSRSRRWAPGVEKLGVRGRSGAAGFRLRAGTASVSHC